MDRVSVPTIGEWLSILELNRSDHSGPPYFENFGERLTRSPKTYWGDSGLTCYLLGLTSTAGLERSPFLGALFEGFVGRRYSKVSPTKECRRSSTTSAISRAWR